MVTQIGIKHLEGSFAGVDRTKLFTQSWQIQEGRPRANLIILHGLKDHSGRYSEIADDMVQHGFAVYAFDMRGHGRSDGKKAYVSDFDYLIADLKIFIQDLRQKNSNLPVFMFGHSMGGTTVALSVIEKVIEFQGVILSAAALVPGAGISPLLIRITRFLGQVAPQLPLMNLPNQNFSRDPKVVAAMGADPLILQKNGPVRTAAQLLRAMQRVQHNLQAFSAPVLILHGTADLLTNPEGSKKLFELAGSKDKTLKIYEGLVHDLVHEPEKARVIADITTWLESRTPSRS
jgi:acylglycerol lipase